MKYKKYIKKLTTQELGYRKGRLKTGQYFYISKAAVGTFFKELDRYILNDKIRLVFNDPLVSGEMIEATYVYHNDKYAIENGTRNEYRIYLNRDIAKHDLHFQPEDIIVFEWVNGNEYRLDHYRITDPDYKHFITLIKSSKIRGNHALISDQ